MPELEERIAGDMRPYIRELYRRGYVIFAHKFSGRYLKTYDFTAQTIVDVGAWVGTEPIYEAFPGRKFVLIEPIAECEETIKATYPHLDYDFFGIGIGAKPGRMSLITRKGVGWFNGFLERSNDIDFATDQRDVEVKTLDSVLINAGYRTPFGLKIDVEGFELHVLAGAEETLKQTEFLIIESAIGNQFKKPDRFSDLIIAMKNAGFELVDVLNATGQKPQAYDCLFVRKASQHFECQWKKHGYKGRREE